MTTVLVSPGDLVRRLYSSRQDLVFLDDKDWWVCEGSSGRRTPVDVFSIGVKWGDTDPVAIVEAVRSWGPTWMRWVGQADSYELLYRESAVYILHLIAGLRRFQVRHAVFLTSLSHHLDTSFVEIACSQSGIPQVFLYNNGLDGRLLPLIQDHSMADRRPLNAIVSDHSAAAGIAAYLQNKVDGRRPATNQEVKRYYLSPSLAFMIAPPYMARNALRRARRRVTTPGEKFLANFPELSLIDHLRLIERQRRALAFYDRHAVSAEQAREEALAGGRCPTLVIAAHFQPEAACSPEGGVFNNHVDVILALRNMGYNGAMLYKEHFGSYRYFAPILGLTRVGMFRSVSYYRQLLRLGCTLANAAMPLSLDETANHWYVPVTITGSVALERSLAGLPTIYAGHPWYQGLPGTVYISKTMELLANGAEATRGSKAIADAAFHFVDNLLSRKTIVNMPGIGSGVPMTAPESVDAFDREFGTMLSALTSRPHGLDRQDPGGVGPR